MPPRPAPYTVELRQREDEDLDAFRARVDDVLKLHLAISMSTFADPESGRLIVWLLVGQNNFDRV